MHGGGDEDYAGNLDGEHGSAHVRCGLVFVHQSLVQARVLATTQHGQAELQQVGVLSDPLRRGPGLVDAGLRHAVLQDFPMFGAESRHPGVVTRNRRSGRNVAEVQLGLLARDFRRDVARKDQYGIVGPVIGAEPFLHILERGRFEVGHGADREPGVGVLFREKAANQVLEHLAVRLILALALFVLDHAALLIEAFLGDGAEQVAHAVGFHPQREVEAGRRHCLEVVGAVERRGAVLAGGTDALERFEVLVVVVLRAIEHQVLEQMCKPGSTALLILRAHVVPDIDRHDGRLVILVHDNGQAVVEFKLGERDVHRLGARGQCRRQQDHCHQNRTHIRVLGNYWC